MKKTLRNIGFGATLVGALFSFGMMLKAWRDQSYYQDYYHDYFFPGINETYHQSQKYIDKYHGGQSYYQCGSFCGYPVTTEIRKGQRAINILERSSNRGYRPARLSAKDTNQNRFGFEDIQIFPAYDYITGIDSSKMDALNKFRDKIELERIFAYVGVAGLPRDVLEAIKKKGFL